MRKRKRKVVLSCCNTLQNLVELGARKERKAKTVGENDLQANNYCSSYQYAGSVVVKQICFGLQAKEGS